MSETAETKTPLFGGKTAAILGGVFLAGFAICAVLAGVDRAHRPKLEEITAPSAVGDPIVFVAPQTPSDAPAMAKGGVPLYFVKNERARDEELRKAGTDDTGKIPLYYRLKDDGTQKEGYRAKLAPGIYAVLMGKK